MQHMMRDTSKFKPPGQIKNRYKVQYENIRTSTENQYNQPITVNDRLASGLRMVVV